MSVAVLPEKETRWTPRLIKRLRGIRSLPEFASLLEVNLEEVGLWESGQLAPANTQLANLAALAEREQFLKEWKLAGSGVLINELETASAELADEMKQLLDDRAQELRG